MGNAASTSADDDVDGVMGSRSRGLVTAPPEWKNEKPFHVISPASDLSNPSNFRHRRTQQTPVQERRRTSKVMSKEHNVNRINDKRTSLPPPEQFYFPSRKTEEKHGRIVSDKVDTNNVMKKETKAAVRKGRVLRFRRKASRAKLVFTCCYDSNKVRRQQLTSEGQGRVSDGTEIVFKDTLEEELSNGNDSKNMICQTSSGEEEEGVEPVPNDSNEAFAQIDPNIPSQVSISKTHPYLHSASAYFRQIATDADHASQSPMPSRIMEESIMEEDSVDVRAEVEASPVAALFLESERKKKSLLDDIGSKDIASSPFDEPKEDETVLTNCLLRKYKVEDEKCETIDLNQLGPQEAWLKLVQEVTLQYRKKVNKKKDDRRESDRTNATGPQEDCELQKAQLEADVQRQIDEQLENLKRPRRTNKSNSSSGSCRGRSVEPRPPLPAKHRESTGSLVEQIRQQYEQELENISHFKKDGSQKDLWRKAPSEASIVQRNREIFEKKKRSSSLPPSPYKPNSNQHQKTQLQSKPKRSASVPASKKMVAISQPSLPRRSSDMPALLVLAGWPASKQDTRRSSQDISNKLPALLTLAGWDGTGKEQCAQRKSSEHAQNPSKPRQSSLSGSGQPAQAQAKTKKETKTFQNRLSTGFVNESELKDPPAEIRVKDRKMRPSTAMYHRVSDPILRAVETDQAHEIRHCLSDSAFPLVTKTENQSPLQGMTTAQMLQQTYGMKTTLGHTKRLYSSDYGLYNGTGKELVAASPAMSVDTQVTTPGSTPVPMVSDQANMNAAFLFASGNRMRLAPVEHREIPSFEITTLESRDRISGTSMNSSKSTASLSSRSRAMTFPISSVMSVDKPPSEVSQSKHVRFSDVDEKLLVEPIDPQHAAEQSLTQHSSCEGQMMPEMLSVPPIESKMSDLTDTTGYPIASIHRESTASGNNGQRSMSVEPIPEDDAEDAADTPFKSVVTQVSQHSADYRNETDGDLTDDETVDSSRHVVHWSYSDANCLGKGVTPLLKGKNISGATKSPFLRFEAARTKFAVADSILVRKSPEKKARPADLPVGKSKVLSLISQMEARAQSTAQAKCRLSTPENEFSASSVFRKEFKSTAPQDEQTEESYGKEMDGFMRSPTLVSGEVVQSPCKAQDEQTQPIGSVTSKTSNQNHVTINDQSESFLEENECLNDDESALKGIAVINHDEDEASIDEEDRSPKMYCLPTAIDRRHEYESMASLADEDDEVSDDDSADAFADILKQQVKKSPDAALLDAEETDDEDDAFADILRSEDDGESTAEDTVSTVCQDRPRQFNASNFSSYRLSLGEMSKYSNATSSGSATVSTVRQNRLSTASSSSVSTMQKNRLSFASNSSENVKGRLSFASSGVSSSMSSVVGQPKVILPFRENAPVKPSEQQVHRTFPGESLYLSPMQRTPGQARKWRALAAAAHEKDSQRKQQAHSQSNVSRGRVLERNKNVMMGR